MIGRKIGMSRMFSETGDVQGVTLVEAGPCVVTDVRTNDRNGYEAVQLGFEEMKEHRATKPMRGAFKKNGLPCFKTLKEFRVEGAEYKVGDKVTVEMFVANTRVNVTGTGRGHGFQGVVKRHGFRGAPMSHGASKVHRKPMSAGATDAARIIKGKRSPGRMGGKQVTISNLEVALVDAEKNLIALKGPVPGKRNSLVIIQPC